MILAQQSGALVTVYCIGNWLSIFNAASLTKVLSCFLDGRTEKEEEQIDLFYRCSWVRS